MERPPPAAIFFPVFRGILRRNARATWPSRPTKRPPVAKKKRKKDIKKRVPEKMPTFQVHQNGREKQKSETVDGDY